MYLPKHKILCTGDACINGAFNYMGHSDSASWIRVLDRGHAARRQARLSRPRPARRQGRAGKQRRYFVELRDQVKKGIDANKEFEDILKSSTCPGTRNGPASRPATRKAETQHVYDEFTGPGRAVGPDRGLRHLRGPVADEKYARLDQAEADRRPQPDAGRCSS